MSDKIHIRNFDPAEKEQVYSLILSVMEKEFENIPSHLYLKDIMELPDSYSGKRENFFVVESEGNIIGTIGIKEDDEKTALMRRFFVKSDLRGKGLGLKLIDQAMEFCKKSGYEVVLFDGNSQMHKVKRVLQKYGFIEEQNILFSSLSIFKLKYVL